MEPELCRACVGDMTESRLLGHRGSMPSLPPHMISWAQAQALPGLRPPRGRLLLGLDVGYAGHNLVSLRLRGAQQQRAQLATRLELRLRAPHGRLSLGLSVGYAGHSGSVPSLPDLTASMMMVMPKPPTARPPTSMTAAKASTNRDTRPVRRMALWIGWRAGRTRVRPAEAVADS